jgi:hypothetical protein
MKYIRDVVLTEEEYVKPQIEIIEIENEEGILASSAGSFGDGGGYSEW